MKTKEQIVPYINEYKEFITLPTLSQETKDTIASFIGIAEKCLESPIDTPIESKLESAANILFLIDYAGSIEISERLRKEFDLTGKELFTEKALFLQTFRDALKAKTPKKDCYLIVTYTTPGRTTYEDVINKSDYYVALNFAGNFELSYDLRCFIDTRKNRLDLHSHEAPSSELTLNMRPELVREIFTELQEVDGIKVTSVENSLRPHIKIITWNGCKPSAIFGK